VRLLALGGGDADAPEFHAVGSELAAPEIVERPRLDAVAGQVPVERARPAIARLADVAHEHAPAAAPEHQRRAQAGRPASDDDHVEHLCS